MKVSASRHDNRYDPVERPFRVGSDGLERALRESLSRQVAEPVRLSADPAGLAIRRARRVQRRRAAAGFALAAVVATGFTAFVAQLADGPRQQGQIVVIGDPPGPAVPTRGAPSPRVTSLDFTDRPSVDVISGRKLITTGGQMIDLSTVGSVEGAVRAADGWLVTGAPTAAGRRLWFVDRVTTRMVLAGVDALALSDDGGRVAWRDGNELVAARVAGGRAVSAVRTPAPDQAVPVGFVGDAVLVRSPAGAGRPERYDLWRPGGGAFHADGNPDTLGVYGVLPDGRAVGLIAAGATGRPCLALLDPAHGLAPVRSACSVQLTVGGHGLVSPDGRWLVADGRSGRSDAALLIDLASVFDGASDPPARAAGPPLAGDGRWLNSATLLHGGADGTLVRIATGEIAAGGGVQRVPVPVAEGPVLVVTATS